MSLGSDGLAPAGDCYRMVVGGMPFYPRPSHSLSPQDLPVLRVWRRDA